MIRHKGDIFSFLSALMEPRYIEDDATCMLFPYRRVAQVLALSAWQDEAWEVPQLVLRNRESLFNRGRHVCK
jgi:hypothetical protein